jgi:hypothetical protein
MDAVDLAAKPLVCADAQTELQRHFSGSRGPAQRLRELHLGRFNPLLVPSRASAQVIGCAEFVEHRSADARAHEGVVLDALRGVESLPSVHEAEQPDLDQVVNLDVWRQLGNHLVGDAPHHCALVGGDVPRLSCHRTPGSVAT